jgi:hypothetical protein
MSQRTVETEITPCANLAGGVLFGNKYSTNGGYINKYWIGLFLYKEGPGYVVKNMLDGSEHTFNEFYEIENYVQSVVLSIQ